jgi:hypothetical protein
MAKVGEHMPTRFVSSRPAPDPHATPIDRLILVPIFDDWAALSLLLPVLDQVLSAAGLDAHLLIVDDGSTKPASGLELPKTGALRSVSVLSLRRNLGHQRAIAVGLAYVEQNIDPRVVVVMDGDGEDDSRDVPRLLAKLDETGQEKIVFAERLRRSEPLFFRTAYAGYRALHLLLTGYRVRVGNYSAIPRSALSRLVVVSELWNHYSAATFNARIAYTTIPTARARRLDGNTKMGFISLVVHGLSALSVYSHIIGVRLLVATVGFIALVLLALLGLLGAAFGGLHPAPPWAVVSMAALVVLLSQLVIGAMLFGLMMLAGRQGSSFIPIRDYAYFVDRVVTLSEKA